MACPIRTTCLGKHLGYAHQCTDCGFFTRNNAENWIYDCSGAGEKLSKMLRCLGITEERYGYLRWKLSLGPCKCEQRKIWLNHLTARIKIWLRPQKNDGSTGSN